MSFWPSSRISFWALLQHKYNRCVWEMSFTKTTPLSLCVSLLCQTPPPKKKTHPRTHTPTIVQNEKEKKKIPPGWETKATQQKPKNKHQVKYLPWFMLISRAHSWVLSLNLNIRPCMHHYILIRILLSSNEPILFIPFPKNWPAIKLTLNTH